jgi:hypothetical protein
VSLALAVGGCGGGSSTTSPPSSASGSGVEPSAAFLRPNGANDRIVKFGEEASVEEREAANAVVVKNLRAREVGQWATQCATLDKVGIKEIPGAIGKERECPKLLEQFAQPIAGTKEVREDRLSGPIAALRVEGKKGYALFHGNDGNDYALALQKEDDTWKVSSVNTIELGKTESGASSTPKDKKSKA